MRKINPFFVKTLVLVFFMIIGTLLTSPAQGGEYDGRVRGGQSPLKAKARVHITTQTTGLTLKTGGREAQAWDLPTKSIRGAKLVEGGVLLFWYDGSGAIQNIFIEMGKAHASELTAEITKIVTDYYSDAEYKARFETYKEQALKEAQ